GDGLRPGALADANDPAQLHELRVLAGLARRARDAGVQVMIEGPGHVPLHLIADHVREQKTLCDGAPFYVLGPLVTDVAPGYDHITSAIGGAIAAAAGADFLCYVTPSEHLSLPGPAEVRAGVMAARIAAHAGDLAKGLPGADDWDRSLSECRRRRDWESVLKQSIDPTLARRLREQGRPADADVCSMCGEFCVFRLQDESAQQDE
ncbi:MAG TPA: phosphomethylpyrimidine synthase ThiC, partial [Planctomycetota bacterium]|nr:phosphomethylpyrimidine synthase ThiC [Planctomycetota bacterium]